MYTFIFYIGEIDDLIEIWDDFMCKLKYGANETETNLYGLWHFIV